MSRQRRNPVFQIVDLDTTDYPASLIGKICEYNPGEYARVFSPKKKGGNATFIGRCTVIANEIGERVQRRESVKIGTFSDVCVRRIPKPVLYEPMEEIDLEA